MDSLEVRARTAEEAIQKALDQLGLSRDAVEVVVVKEGRIGILGLGSEEAIVRVTPLATETSPDEVDVNAIARTILEQLLRLLGVSATVDLQVEPAIDEEDAETLAFDIRGDDLGILIGRRGQTLAALQHIVRLLVARETNKWAPIAIDVEGYKQRRYRALQGFAREMAGRVKSRRVPFTLEPMPPYERRIIHLALADDPQVMTESIGQGDERKVVIRLKSKTR